MNGLHSAELVDKIVIFVEKHMEENNCLAIVEEIIGDDCPNYQSIFEEQVGMPLSEYIAKVQLQKAEKSLKESNKDFNGITMAVGMNG